MSNQLAPILWYVSLGLLAWLVAGNLVIDEMLRCAGRLTESDWLREHPLCYWIPAVVVVGGVVYLGLHLFVLFPKE
jgi:hypothetical protein